jgi:hypothetical protein
MEFWWNIIIIINNNNNNNALGNEILSYNTSPSARVTYNKSYSDLPTIETDPLY